MSPETILLAETARRYAEIDYPALYAQWQEWRAARPLAGCTVLDATPLFFNTFPKYAALLAAGADLTVCIPGNIPHDKDAAEFLKRAGVPIALGTQPAGPFDIVLDNGGANAHVPARYGYAELTRTGAHRYAGATAPVFVADEGRIKAIETSLGTGDGFARAMEQLGHGDFKGRSVLLFGCGKVGRGIAVACLKRGAFVYTVDDGCCVKPPEGVPLIDKRDIQTVRRAIAQAWAVVCATGRAEAAADYAADLVQSEALLANMGVDDEFGPAMPAARVLFDKQPLNFSLKEPTHLRYIEATLALHNAGAVALRGGAVKPGVQPPPESLENEILAQVRVHGRIAKEMDAIFPF